MLVGHGTKDPRGVDEFLATAGQVAARARPWAVEACFLEFAAPTIQQGFERLAASKANRVIVAPVMLFAARHIRQDIPAAVAQAAVGFPQVVVAQAQHLGCHPALVRHSRCRYDEALAGAPAVPEHQTALVMVGRGSRDGEATKEMLRFAELRQKATAVDVRTAFLAMTSPGLEPVLRELGRSAIKRVVVQPHLLFAGELLLRIRALVDHLAGEYQDIDWRVTDHLGPQEPVVAAIVERACEAQMARQQAP